MKHSLQSSGSLMAAAILAFSISAASAATHHHQSWVTGDVATINAEGRSIRLHEPGKSTDTQIVWDARTQGFSSVKDHAHPFEKDILPQLRPGNHVRVRCVARGAGLLARHVVLENPESSQSKTRAGSN